MVEKDSGNGVKGFEFRSPTNRTKWEALQNAIYDPSTKQFLGRTGKNWGQLLVFYTIFYVILAALFAICMQGLLATLDDKEPKWQLERSLIGTNPGLGFRPISDRTEEGSLIWYDTKNKTTSEKWVKLLDEFLEQYKVNHTGKNFQTCDFEKKADPGHVCIVDLEQFGPCGPKNSYGYNGSSPCVFLKLNKIFGWVPKYYETPQEGMPKELVETINNLPPANRTQIWISCVGENPVDKEHVVEFEYFPQRGFPGYYFPYVNTENYMSPLIAVQIRNPKPNVIVSVECRAWAKNILYRGGNLQREGSIHFEILQDTK